MKHHFLGYAVVCIGFWTLLAAQPISQYPFEKYPLAVTQDYELKGFDEGAHGGTFAAFIPALFPEDELGLVQFSQVEINPDSSATMITVSRKDQIMHQSFAAFLPFYNESAVSLDMNGDGLKDLRFSFESGGNGLAANWRYMIYLIQRKDGGFDRYFFLNMLPERVYGVERDVDGDGQYELLVCDHRTPVEEATQHSYWYFNIFRFRQGKMENLNAKLDFPLVIPHRDVAVFTPADDLSREQRQAYFLMDPVPDFSFSEGKIVRPDLAELAMKAETYTPTELQKEQNRPQSNRPVQPRNLIFWLIGGTAAMLLLVLSFLFVRSRRKLKP